MTYAWPVVVLLVMAHSRARPLCIHTWRHEIGLPFLCHRALFRLMIIPTCCWAVALSSFSKLRTSVLNSVDKLTNIIMYSLLKTVNNHTRPCVHTISWHEWTAWTCTASPCITTVITFVFTVSFVNHRGVTHALLPRRSTRPRCHAHPYAHPALHCSLGPEARQHARLNDAPRRPAFFGCHDAPRCI